jgi:hypothetical protein
MKKQDVPTEGSAPGPFYSEAFKRAVVTDYERGILNKDQIQAKYGGNSRVLEWCLKYGKLHYPRSGITGRPPDSFENV